MKEVIALKTMRIDEQCSVPFDDGLDRPRKHIATGEKVYCSKWNGRESACSLNSVEKTFPIRVRGTAGPSAPPDFLSEVAASVNSVWFSLKRTTYVVAGESGEVGNPGTLGMTRGSVAIPGKVVATWNC